MRTLFTRINEIGPVTGGESTLVIGFDPVDGWDSDPVLIERDRIHQFLARVRADCEEALVGLPVRVTVDDDGHGERIVFLAPNQLAEEPPPAANAEPEVGAISVVPADRVAAFVADASPEAWADAGAEVPERTADPCAERLAPESAEERKWEEDTRAAIAKAAAAPLDGRYFLYRETYGDAGRWDAFELEPGEFARLAAIGPYLHDDGCVVHGEPDGEPDPADAIGRLLDRVTSRQSAELSREDVERLTGESRVISCAVY